MSATSTTCCAAASSTCASASSTGASRWSGRTATTGCSSLNGLDARSHASQGEQRTLALGLRLAGHRLVARIVGSDPVLLLDDVFSELDPTRSAGAGAAPPATQTLLTTAGLIPEGIAADRRLTVHAGAVTEG